MKHILHIFIAASLMLAISPILAKAANPTFYYTYATTCGYTINLTLTETEVKIGQIYNDDHTNNTSNNSFEYYVVFSYNITISGTAPSPSEKFYTFQYFSNSSNGFSELTNDIQNVPISNNQGTFTTPNQTWKGSATNIGTQLIGAAITANTTYEGNDGAALLNALGYTTTAMELNTPCGETTITATSVTTLPITLSQFNASLDNKSVLLDWTTATEINNNYFVVERSEDSKNFDSIGVVKGAGNSSAIINYNFRDDNAVAGTDYYRLRQVDYDGKSTISNIVNLYVSNTSATNASNISIYPNPGNGNVTINGNWSNLKNVIVYNMTGASVYTQNISSNKVQLPSSLPPGMYIINLIDQIGKRYSNKYLLIK